VLYSPPQRRNRGRLAAAVVLCGLVLMMCSSLSYAQRNTQHSLGTAVELDPIQAAPCNFPVQGGDAWYPPGSPTLTSCIKVNVGGCATLGDPNNTLPTITAYVAISHQPANITPLGTIVLLSGDGGKSFFNAGDGNGDNYVADYYNALFTTVQVAWAGDWNDNSAMPPPSEKSVKDEACRPATLLHFIYHTYFNDTGAMCAQGHSGGASAIAYAMEFYGADRGDNTVNNPVGYLDTVVMTSGPALADIYNGCHYDPHSSQAPASDVCQGGVCVGAATDWPSCLEYPEGGQANCFPDGDPNRANYPVGMLYDSAEGVTMHTIGDFQQAQANCNNAKGNDASTATLDGDWHDMSLVPVPYGHYPQTFVYGFLCSGPNKDSDGNDTSNSTAAQAWSYLSALSVSTREQLNGFPLIYRVDGCADPEMIWAHDSMAEGGTTGYATSRDAMETNCFVH
jgi:hypothetical protein